MLSALGSVLKYSLTYWMIVLLTFVYASGDWFVRTDANRTDQWETGKLVDFRQTVTSTSCTGLWTTARRVCELVL